MGSRGIKAILVTVGVLTLASVGQAMPAAAALTPTLYGFGSNQWGELGNGTTSAAPSLSPTPAAGLPGTIRQPGGPALQRRAADRRQPVDLG